MRALLAISHIVLSLALPISAQQAAKGKVLTDAPSDGVSFDFTPRADARQSSYIIAVPVDGLTRYIEFPVDDPNGPAAHPVLFKISDRTLQRLMSSYADVYRDAAQGKCETHLKGIASTGKKLLTYYRDGHSLGCTFDYADDATLNGVADAFESIASTLQFGERLQHDLRYDRLGLDAEIDALLEENSAGRAIEMQSIATTLQAIIDDDRVLERVRRKAAHLLESAGIPVKNYMPGPSAR